MKLPVLGAVDANPANAIARSLTGRDYISHTQVSTFTGCPLRWYFQYVAGRPHEQKASGLVFGGAIHAALEAYFRARLAGDGSPDAGRLVEAFDGAWEADATVPIAFGRHESRDSLRRLARRMLEQFLASDAARPAGTILGVEEEVRGTAIEGVPDLLARIDLLVVTDDALVIRDFKTSRGAWTPQKLAESAPQLLLYGELLSSWAADYGGLPVRMEFIVLTKSAGPVVESHGLEPDGHRLRQIHRTLERVWAAMCSGHIYPNRSTLNCSGCPFQRACFHWCE